MRKIKEIIKRMHFYQCNVVTQQFMLFNILNYLKYFELS